MTHIRRNARVVRRRHGESFYLLHAGDAYELDDFADAVWLSCEQLAEQGQLSAFMARSNLGEEECQILLAKTLAEFEAFGLLSRSQP